MCFERSRLKDFEHLLANVFDLVVRLAVNVVFAGAGQTFDELRCSAGRAVVQRHASQASEGSGAPLYGWCRRRRRPLRAMVRAEGGAL